MTAPLSYNVDEETCTATVTYHAQATIGEWRKALGRLLMHAAFQPHFAVVLDRRRIYTPGATDYINAFVGVLDEERGKGNLAGPCAIIVSDPASYEMGKMAAELSIFADSIRPFYRLEEAELWVAEAGVGVEGAGLAVAACS
jgi:hypothetical protein